MGGLAKKLTLLLLNSRVPFHHIPALPLQEVVVALSRYVQQYEQRFLSAALTVTDELVTKLQRVSICEDDESIGNSALDKSI